MYLPTLVGFKKSEHVKNTCYQFPVLFDKLHAVLYIQEYKFTQLSRCEYSCIHPIHYWWAVKYALREESSQTNVILQYKLLAAILCAVCSVIQQS